MSSTGVGPLDRRTVHLGDFRHVTKPGQMKVGKVSRVSKVDETTRGCRLFSILCHILGSGHPAKQTLYRGVPCFSGDSDHFWRAPYQ